MSNHRKYFPKTFVCETCGKSFERNNNREYRFCSPKCRAQTINKPKEYKQINNTCKNCGKVFTTTPSRKRDYCSLICGAKRPKPYQSKPKIDTTCLECCKQFTTTRSQIKYRGGGKYCSRDCAGRAQSKKLMQTGGPNYKGGVSKNNPYFRGSNWNSQRRKALKRDNHECQVCRHRGNFFKPVDIHHIKPYRLFNGDFESANELSNLVTLCRKHHGLVESGKIPCPKPKV